MAGRAGWGLQVPHGWRGCAGFWGARGRSPAKPRRCGSSGHGLGAPRCPRSTRTSGASPKLGGCSLQGRGIALPRGSSSVPGALGTRPAPVTAWGLGQPASWMPACRRRCGVGVSRVPPGSLGRGGHAVPPWCLLTFGGAAWGILGSPSPPGHSTVLTDRCHGRASWCARCCPRPSGQWDPSGVTALCWGSASPNGDPASPRAGCNRAGLSCPSLTPPGCGTTSGEVTSAGGTRCRGAEPRRCHRHRANEAQPGASCTPSPPHPAVLLPPLPLPAPLQPGAGTRRRCSGSTASCSSFSPRRWFPSGLLLGSGGGALRRAAGTCQAPRRAPGR